MVRHWTAADATASRDTESGSKKSWGALVSGLGHDTMRLSLYVISRAGFGVRCEWPGAETSSGEGDVMSANEIPKGHSMSYVESLETLLHKMLVLFMFPASWMSKFLLPSADLADLPRKLPIQESAAGRRVIF